MGKLKPLKGLVLTGGKSTRMGRDKALICYHKVTQYLHVAQLLVPYCSEVYISAEEERSENYINPSYQVLVDKYKDCGPMGGLLTAFEQDPNSAWFVLACDYPLITEIELELLIDQRNTSHLATAFLNEGTKAPEPLITIWESLAQPVVIGSYEKEAYSLRRILQSNEVGLVTMTNHQMFLNVNTIAEMKKVISIIAGDFAQSQKE